MLSKINAMRRDALEKEIGPFRQMDPEELLSEALDAEETARDCGPRDPAFAHFSRRASALLEAAALQELDKA